MRTKAVIVGIEHHNMLNLAREFYDNGEKPDGLIVYEGKFSAIKLSKYWNKVSIIRDDSEIVNTLINTYKEESIKPVLLVTSDGAAREVDENLNLLSRYFICPNMNNKQGMLHRLMDKHEQLQFAKSINLPTIPGQMMDISDLISVNQHFPCIIKPLECGTGRKSDISICSNENDFIIAKEKFLEHKCNNVLVQDYIRYDYEFEICGFCTDKEINNNSFFATKFVRSWPQNKGTACFGHLITNLKIIEVCSDVLESIRKVGFRGLINIEFFYCNGEVYLNEINWRNAGGVYNGHSVNANIGFRYYLDIIEEECKIGPIKRKNDFFMTEYSDFRYPLYCKYGWMRWVKDVKRVKNFALFHKEDMKPALLQYAKILIHILKRNYK